MLACMTLFKRAGKMAAIHHFRIDLNLPCLPPKFCITVFSDIPWVLQSSRGKSKTMIIKIWAGPKQAALWSSWKWGIGENKNHQEFSDEWWDGEIMFTCEIWQNRMSFLLNVFWAFLQYQKDRTFCLKSNQVKYTCRSACTKRMSQVTGH